MSPTHSKTSSKLAVIVLFFAIHGLVTHLLSNFGQAIVLCFWVLLLVWSWRGVWQLLYGQGEGFPMKKEGVSEACLPGQADAFVTSEANSNGAKVRVSRYFTHSSNPTSTQRLKLPKLPKGRKVRALISKIEKSEKHIAGWLPFSPSLTGPTLSRPSTLTSKQLNGPGDRSSSRLFPSLDLCVLSARTPPDPPTTSPRLDETNSSVPAPAHRNRYPNKLKDFFRGPIHSFGSSLTPTGGFETQIASQLREAPLASTLPAQKDSSPSLRPSTKNVRKMEKRYQKVRGDEQEESDEYAASDSSEEDDGEPYYDPGIKDAADVWTFMTDEERRAKSGKVQAWMAKAERVREETTATDAGAFSKFFNMPWIRGDMSLSDQAAMDEQASSAKRAVEDMLSCGFIETTCVRCPGCEVWIERDAGSEGMRCFCGTGFCWGCEVARKKGGDMQCALHHGSNLLL